MGHHQDTKKLVLEAAAVTKAELVDDFVEILSTFLRIILWNIYPGIRIMEYNLGFVLWNIYHGRCITMPSIEIGNGRITKTVRISINHIIASLDIALKGADIGIDPRITVADHSGGTVHFHQLQRERIGNKGRFKIADRLPEPPDHEIKRNRFRSPEGNISLINIVVLAGILFPEQAHIAAQPIGDRRFEFKFNGRQNHIAF